MNGTFYKLVWEKGQTTHLVQGVKRNRRPRGALYGGNGSYMVAGQPARLYLIVKGDDGEIYRSNIYDRVMEETGRKRMSEQLYETLSKKFSECKFTISSDNYITWDCNLL